MSLKIKVAEHIINHGGVNMTKIVKEVEGVDDYNRAAEIIEDLERAGIISPFDDKKSKQISMSPRKVLVTDINYAKKLLNQNKH